MPLNARERVLVDSVDVERADLDFRDYREDRAPVEKQKIGRVTLVLMILNRIIGSGIFFAPKRVSKTLGMATQTKADHVASRC